MARRRDSVVREGTAGATRTFRDLIAWQRAMEFTEAIYRFTKAFPRDEQFGLSSQLRRASASIPANIAEGYRRGHRSEYIQFLRIALGSHAEAETFIELARRLNLGSEETRPEVERLCQEVGRLLAGLLRGLKSASGGVAVSPTRYTPPATRS